jgi:tetratricopeptide (TPR) repeat protein
MARAFCCALLLAVAVCLSAAERTFEVRGQIEPAPSRATVILAAATTPFTTRTASDSAGRFRFRNIRTGAYKVLVFAPGAGEIEKTIEVGPSLADSNNRISVTVSFSESVSIPEAMERQHTVDLRRLGIPDAAKREYAEAQNLLGKNQVDQAIRRLEKAVGIAPRFSEAWNNLGTIAFHARRYQDAEGYFRKALDAEPGSYDPTVNLGAAVLLQGRLEEALKYNLYAVVEQPRDPLANAQTGQNYLFLGNLDLALRYLQEAKRLDPNHFSFPQLYLARIYAQRSELKAAAAELEDFLARHPDASQAPKYRAQLEDWRKQ